MIEGIEQLPIDELAKLVEAATREIKAKQAAMSHDAISKINELAASIGVKVEIMWPGDEPFRKIRPVKRFVHLPPKYQDPVTGDTWSGRGRKPIWLTAALNLGRTVEEFLIP